MKYLFALLIFLLSLLLLFPPLGGAEDLPSNSTAADNNQFAIHLYGKLSTEDKNLFFSPWSIHAALSVVGAGARNETAAQINGVLRGAKDRNGIFAKGAGFESALSESESFELRSANGVWLEKRFSPLESYLSIVRSKYHASIDTVDFIGDPLGAIARVNSWVEEKTAHRITDLLQRDAITPATRMVITNAVYFKGVWVNKFEREATHPDIFHVSEDTDRTVSMMSQVESFRYAETSTAQIVELPYEGGVVSMVVLLPRDRNGLGTLEKSLQLSDLDSSLESASMKKVRLQIPQFKLESETSLAEPLMQLGMPVAFEFGKADFSGIDGGRELYISTVVHKAFVEVNEDGTEAAAATAIVARAGAHFDPNQPVLFRADHPFLFLIRHVPTNTFLFVGSLKNPD